MTTTSTQTQTLAPPKASRVPLGWLDSLRALAALYVAMSHILTTIWPQPHDFHGLIFITAGPFRYAHSAVGLFIVLSGFSLMIPITRGSGLLQGGAWKFFGRRAKRILPTYYAALAMSLLLIHFFLSQKTGTNWDTALPVTASDSWMHVLLLQDVFSRGKINPAMWSISVEWRIYFLFPILVLLFKKWGGFKVTLGMFGVSLLMLLCFVNTPLDGIMPAYYTLFTLGMLACEIGLSHEKYLSEMRNRLPWSLAGWMLFCVLLAMLFKWRSNVSSPLFFLEDILTGMISAALLVALSKPGDNRFREYLSWKPLVFVGTFAYSIYLIHMPLVQLVWQYELHPLHKGSLATYLLLVGNLPLIIGIAYLFFLAFERPFLNTKRRESMSETAKDAALSPAP